MGHSYLFAPLFSAALFLSLIALLLLSQTKLKSLVRPGDLQTWQRALHMSFPEVSVPGAGCSWPCLEPVEPIQQYCS